MGLETVSTAQAAELLAVSEEPIRNGIAGDELAGVTMQGGAWRIPVGSLRVQPPGSSDGLLLLAEPPPYIKRLIEQLDAFETGTIPCADATRIAGIGIKVMRS